MRRAISSRLTCAAALSSTAALRRCHPPHEEQINLLMADFAESRELIEDARESMGTTYFAEDLEDAKEHTEKTLASYEQLLKDLPEKQRIAFEKESSLKFAQLRAELETVLHHE